MTWGRRCWQGRSPALVPRAPGLPLRPGPRLDLDDLPALAGWTLPGRQGQVQSRGSPQSWALGPLTPPAHAPGTNQRVSPLIGPGAGGTADSFWTPPPGGDTSGHHRTGFRHPPPHRQDPHSSQFRPPPM